VLAIVTTTSHSGYTQNAPGVQVAATSSFVTDVFRNAADNAKAVEFALKSYPRKVVYYGKITNQEAIIRDKAAFNARWAERHYEIQPGSLVVTCDDEQGVKSECTASGMLDSDAVIPLDHPISADNTAVLRVEVIHGGPYLVAAGQPAA
jgi:hypothetical protein